MPFVMRVRCLKDEVINCIGFSYGEIMFTVNRKNALWLVHSHESVLFVARTKFPVRTQSYGVRLTPRHHCSFGMNKTFKKVYEFISHTWNARVHRPQCRLSLRFSLNSSNSLDYFVRYVSDTS